ncbi:anti-sigma factor RsbA family regulatory protein [Streptomyces minutiscleroticus]|uniref:Anti-sigma regulatory factor n=1 Tax=Streptomyces minutiscleroticus TaxID=68238 RepID=A0A918U6N0_9ACTN|nr:anti-sigma factor RsbA family regulatory protein [Streptomyces minutiscleroticus]GGY00619.1 anti-sigma regulatory factor [Streptomyces minutiscleroticus]
MSAAVADEAFEHPALFYSSKQEYTEQTVAFVREGLAAGEPVAVAVPGPNLELIKTALAASAEDLLLVDMERAGRNPGRIIPGVLRHFADAHAEARVRIIGEPIWAGRSPVEYPACAQHEALINAAFEGRAAIILCPYDESRLEEQVLADARITHPTLIRAGQEEVSDVYDWQEVVARYNQALPPAPHAATFSYEAEDLPRVRHFAVEQAVRLGLTGGRLQDAQLAVAELTTNSVLHGGGRGTLAIWAHDGQVVVEVRDAGHLSDPLAGRRPPQPRQIGGRGLMLVHYVSDLVRVHTGTEGTTVRFYLTI